MGTYDMTIASEEDSFGEKVDSGADHIAYPPPLLLTT